MKLKDGLYEGFFHVGGKKVPFEATLGCSRSDGASRVYEGDGVDQTGENFRLHVTVDGAAPFRTALQRKGDGKAVVGEGFCDRTGASIFGTVPGSGEFLVRWKTDQKPVLAAKARLRLQEELLEMGFEALLVEDVLNLGLGKEAAVERLMKMLEDSGGALAAPAADNTNHHHNEQLADLVGMGFEREAARIALEAAGGEVATAVNLLTEQMN